MVILLRLLAASIAAALTAAPLVVIAPTTDDGRPNVIVFVGDDLGWRDPGAYGNPFIRTPSIDRPARSAQPCRRHCRGIAFEQCSSSPIRTPAPSTSSASATGTTATSTSAPAERWGRQGPS